MEVRAILPHARSADLTSNPSPAGTFKSQVRISGPFFFPFTATLSQTSTTHGDAMRQCFPGPFSCWSPTHPNVSQVMARLLYHYSVHGILTRRVYPLRVTSKHMR